MYICVLLDSDATLCIVQYYIVDYNTRIAVQDLKKRREYSEFYSFSEAVILHRSRPLQRPNRYFIKK